MPDIKLTAAEAQVLRSVLELLAVSSYSGEIGVVHGADRFVSGGRPFGKPDRKILDDIARRLGMEGMRVHAKR